MKLGPPQDLPRRGPRTGTGALGLRIAVAGHFGEFLQGRIGPDGPVALVSLPAPGLRVSARLMPGPFGLHGAPFLERAAAAALWRAFGAAPRGRLLLRAGMPPGGGAGSSTAALIAAARLVAAALGAPPPDAPRLARICLALEGATDPLMYAAPARLLWAPRTARALGASLVVAVNTDASVKRLGKGDDRPLNSCEDRMAVLAALEAVSLVVPFSEDSALEVVQEIEPEIYAKGGDYDMAAIPEGKAVLDAFKTAK